MRDWFPGGSAVKNLSAMREIEVWSLSQEDPLEEEMATHSSILAWEIPWTEEPGGLQSMGSRKSQMWFSDQTTTTTARWNFLEAPFSVSTALIKFLITSNSLLCSNVKHFHREYFHIGLKYTECRLGHDCIYLAGVESSDLLTPVLF